MSHEDEAGSSGVDWDAQTPVKFHSRPDSRSGFRTGQERPATVDFTYRDPSTMNEMQICQAAVNPAYRASPSKDPMVAKWRSRARMW